ncbi:hypothetical protein BH10PSE2_BH10PSE2_08070 [soil metagenome]
MSAYFIARIFSWLFLPAWILAAVVLANSLSLPWAAAASVALMVGVCVVSYDILVCPKCRLSLFLGGKGISLPRKRCARCDLDLTTHSLGDRQFNEES